MDDTKTATEAPGQAIAPDIEKTDENVEPELGVDAEQKIAELEKEKNRVIEESANYRLAYLKEKKRQSRQDSDIVDEDEDDKIRRIANEALANSRLAEIAREQDSIIKQALKENRELKLAQMKPSSAPSSIGSHTESKSVPDTLVTPEQLVAFKARGWDDKKIERYKQNLIKNVR